MDKFMIMQKIQYRKTPFPRHSNGIPVELKIGGTEYLSFGIKLYLYGQIIIFTAVQQNVRT